MNIHEFQAKALLREHGVAVPEGGVVRSAEEAHQLARNLGGTVVVKAQIHAGGRGKGKFQTSEGQPVQHPLEDKQLGGVNVVPDADTAKQIAAAMLGNILVTKQSGPQGRLVRQLLVEQGVAIKKEYYFAILLDRALKAPVFVASAEGGTEIEEVAAANPDAIIKVKVDATAGYSPWIGRKLGFALGMGKTQVSALSKLAAALYKAYEQTDASMIEINPLIETADGAIVALDAKMNFDDNAMFRRKAIEALRDLDEEDPLEVEASKYGLNYIKLDGTVGCMVNGAGLAMATMDIIKHNGGSPANFLDVGGGATTEMVTHAFRIILSDPNVNSVLINIFGGIMRCDIVAEGVVVAAKELGVKVPVVVRLEGTNVEEGKEILRASGLDFGVADGMQDAAAKVVAAAGRS